MSETTLTYSLIFLAILLIPLLLSYLYFPDEEIVKIIKKVKVQKIEEDEEFQEQRPVIDKRKPLTFEQISSIFMNQKSEQEDLKEAIEQLVRYHGKIKPKLGDLAHPDFNRYLILIVALSKHPQADADIIISLYHKLSAKNPKYNLNIDEATNKGIAGREAEN